MKAFELNEQLLDLKAGKGYNGYIQFLNGKSDPEPPMSVGLYFLPAGSDDDQQGENFLHGHEQDEVYIILQGLAKIMVAAEDRLVQAGSVVYVAKGVRHYFHSIMEDLKIYVVFSPPYRIENK